MNGIRRTSHSILTLEISISKLRNWVKIASIIFLSIPIVIFLTGWLKFFIAWPATVIFLFGLYKLLRNNGFIHEQDKQHLNVSVLNLGASILLVSIPVLISGVGGVGSQTWDWVKHNAIFLDLVHQAWPLTYQTEGDVVALVYYIAFYLPAALVGKFLGWTSANCVLFLTTWIGTVLTLLWLVVFSRGKTIFAALVLIFFSGMDLIGGFFIKPDLEWYTVITEFRLQWWSNYWLYNNDASVLFYVPHQALGAWLATAILIDSYLGDNRTLPILFLILIVSLWSPFAVVGLIPLFILYLHRSGFSFEIESQLSVVNLIGLVLGLVIFLYYLSRFLTYQLPDYYMITGQEVLPGSFEFLLNRLSISKFFYEYIVFIIFEFLALASVLILIIRKASNGFSEFEKETKMLYVAILVLCVLPFFKYGIYNDLVMRSSMPALFVFQIGVVLVLRIQTSITLRMALVSMLCLGGLNSANLQYQHINNIFVSKRLVQIPSPEHITTLLHIKYQREMRRGFVGQYLGSAKSHFFQYLAPDLKPFNIDHIKQ